ncbi:TPA: helix-turn-helix domain-containing protein [Escherichia coli]|nr:helix-turn-helix domain-containing protein [Escherichia coli]
MRSQNVITEQQREMRKADIREQAKKRDREHLEAQKNQNFTQVYPLGWKRLMELAKGNTAAFGFYTYLAQHIDGSCGAVLADQEFFANEFGVTSRTIRNWVKYLEDMEALVKIPVTGRVCAYALNPHEVWKGYDNTKPYAAFITKTLVNKDGDIQRRIMAMFHGNDARQGMEGDTPEAE